MQQILTYFNAQKAKREQYLYKERRLKANLAAEKQTSLKTATLDSNNSKIKGNHFCQLNKNIELFKNWKSYGFIFESITSLNYKS